MPALPVLMLLVFALTLFCSATLLFLVEPMVGQMLLPLLGGTPAVWNTCMVFYQAVLLAGYAYAHVTTAWLGPRKQAVLHLALLLTPFLFLPLAVNKDLIAGGEENPVWHLLLLLGVTVGVPLFVVCTSAPLLQKWFASTSHPAARDPYFLYGASNLGSMLALLAYPTVVQRYLTLPQQRFDWTVGYGVLVALTAACAIFLWLSPPAVERVPEAVKDEKAKAGFAGKEAVGRNPGRHGKRSDRITSNPSVAEAEPSSMERPVTWGRRFRWVMLAVVPSSLMLGVTTYLTTDIAAIPLLWVPPLALYLLSFIIVFSKVPAWVHRGMVLLLPLLALALVFVMLSDYRPSLGYNIALHLLTLFVVSMVCHGELARDRPDTSHLTEYFLWMSVGGVVGGLFNALVAPVIFNAVVEYQLALVAACLLLPPFGGGKESSWNRYADLGLVVLFLTVGGLLVGLRLREDVPDFGQVPRDAWAWTVGALIVVAAWGAVRALRQPEKRFDRWLDLLLPLSLGVLVLGLFLGLFTDTVGTRINGLASMTHLKPDQVRLLVLYGLPAVLCYTFVERSLRFGLGVGALLLASGFCALLYESAEYRHRSFFGVLKVEGGGERYGEALIAFRRLIHGTTLHGKQFLDDDLRREPLTYYHRSGPVGHLFAAYNDDGRRNLAVIGLGTGTLAAYAEPGQRLTFYDIDPAVRDISYNRSDFFTYVSDARDRKVQLELVLGDARLTMERKHLDESEKYGLLLVDAFSSDAIPIHLITWEALQIYLDHLAEDGILAFHVSNRYLDLRPVLANQAEKAGLAAFYFSDEDEEAPGKARSTWVVLARKEKYLERLFLAGRWEKQKKGLLPALLPLTALPDPGAGLSAQAMLLYGAANEITGPWQRVQTKPEVGIWSDDYSNLLSVFEW